MLLNMYANNIPTCTYTNTHTYIMIHIHNDQALYKPKTIIITYTHAHITSHFSGRFRSVKTNVSEHVFIFIKVLKTLRRNKADHFNSSQICVFIHYVREHLFHSKSKTEVNSKVNTMH